MANKGTVIISLDTELAWGSFDKGLLNKRLKAIKSARYCIGELLKLLEKYKISATWAFVGHLMLDKCVVLDGLKHPDIIRPNHSWFQDDWFRDVPVEKEDENSIWYGRDILNQIISCPVYQEIASHSFSHIIFGDSGCSEECAESDIKKCVDIGKSLGINLSTFIYPRNSVGHKKLLRKYGFKCYRGDGNQWYKKIKRRNIRKVAHIVDDFFEVSPNTTVLEKDEYGLYNIRGNMLYLSRDGFRRFIPIRSRVKKAKKGIDKAVLNKEIFHLCFHPFNLGTDPKGLLKGLEEIFAYIRKNIELGLLDNYTMDQIIQL